MKIPIYAAVAAAGLLFGGGYYLGKGSSSEDAAGDSRRYGSIAGGQSAASPAAPAKGAAGTGTDAAELEPGEARKRIGHALRQTDRFLRMKELATVLAAMNAQNASAIQDGLDEHYRAGFFLNEETGMVQERTGQVLGEKAMTAPNVMPAEPNGKLNYPPQQRMKGWASADPKAAKAWLDKLEPGRVKDGLRAQWLAGLARAAPEELQSLFPTLPAEQQRGLTGGLLDSLQIQGGLPAFNAWFDANAATADPIVLQEAFKGMMWRMGQSAADWDTSCALVKRAAASGMLSRSHFDSFTRNMSTWDPGKCVELLADISTAAPSFAESADSVIAGVVDRSSADSLNTLGTWLNAHKTHPLYDRTAAQFALRTKTDDPGAAAHWAESIQDEALRAKTQETLKGN